MRTCFWLTSTFVPVFVGGGAGGELSESRTQDYEYAGSLTAKRARTVGFGTQPSLEDASPGQVSLPVRLTESELDSVGRMDKDALGHMLALRALNDISDNYVDPQFWASFISDSISSDRWDWAGEMAAASLLHFPDNARIQLEFLTAMTRGSMSMTAEVLRSMVESALEVGFPNGREWQFQSAYSSDYRRVWVNASADGEEGVREESVWSPPVLVSPSVLFLKPAHMMVDSISFAAQDEERQVDQHGRNQEDSRILIWRIINETEAALQREMLGDPVRSRWYHSLGKMYDMLGEHSSAFKCWVMANHIMDRARMHGADLGDRLAGVMVNVISRLTQASVDELHLKTWETLRSEVREEHTHVASDNNYDLYLAWMLPLLMPNAKASQVVSVIRDPRDVGLSCFKSQFSDNFTPMTDLRLIGRHIRLYLELQEAYQSAFASQKKEAVSRGVDMLTVYYEDLVLQPQDTLERVLEFLGLPWDGRCLRPDEDSDISSLVSDNSVFQIKRGLDTSSIGRWKNYQHQLKPLFEELGSLPQDLGYNRSTI